MKKIWKKERNVLVFLYMGVNAFQFSSINGLCIGSPGLFHFVLRLINGYYRFTRISEGFFLAPAEGCSLRVQQEEPSGPKVILANCQTNGWSDGQTNRWMDNKFKGVRQQ